MKLGNPDLIRYIRTEIEKQGPISFARFMHQALYHPEHGYYSSGRCVIGRKGDYFTNVSVGALFGELLAAQFAEMWERLGSVEDFTIIEQGAHDGQFARDVLECVQKRAPEFFAALRYRIVEPFPILKDRQSRTLERFRDKVEWRDSLQPFLGVHFSNELLDAMPVRLISGNMEKLVDLKDDKFVFVERPLSERAAVSKPAMDTGAFNQPALEWIDDIAANLQRGYVITIDYGCFGDEAQRNVQVRAQHRHLDSPFEEIGGADITMPVDWRSVVDRAQAHGLWLAGFTDQYHFLTGIVSALGLPDSPKLARELQTLLHPEMLGRAFHVLGLTKNIDPAAQPLSGFRFARAPRSGA
jgi:SAM-dependent MidA family methyltransferase